MHGLRAPGLFASSLLGLLAAGAACSSSSSTSPNRDAGGHDVVTRDAEKDTGKDVASKDVHVPDTGFDASPVEAIPVTETLTAKTLSAPVQVVRDQWGIPHIYGDNLPDVAYAQGYVTASDRLIEMDLGRRQAEGTLSYLLGGALASIVGTDIAMRSQGLTATAQASWNALKASTDANDKTLAAVMTSSAAGVNAFVADVNAGKAHIAGPVASEYHTSTWTPWTEIDSVALGEYQAFSLAFDSDTEISFTQILAASTATFDDSTNADYLARAGIGKDLEILAPFDPTFTLSTGWTGIGSDAGSASNAVPARRRGKAGLRAGAKSTATAANAKANREMLELLAADEKTMRGIGNGRMVRRGMIGSNNFILGPTLTADHNVIIGNDTHLSLSNPPLFYLVHLVASGGQIPVDAMGVIFPGIPGIVLGNNNHIAWAATNNFIDVTDVYQETVVSCTDGSPYAGSGNPCVKFNGMNVPLTASVEKFPIGILGNVSSTVSQTLYSVPQHGPIIPRLDSNYNVLPLGSTELSIKYTGYQPAQLLRGLLGVFTASSMQEAVASLDRDFAVGGQNWVIGDDQGNFGWTQTCVVPRRAAGHAPWLVLPGDGTAEWNGNMDPHYIPHAYNPSAGFITTANNDPIGVTANNDPFFGQPMVGGSPLYLGFDYDPGTRVGRMTKRIESDIMTGHKFTLADVASIQGDRVSEWGQALAPTFVQTAADLAAEIATPNSHPNLTAIAAGADATAKGLVQTAHDIMAAWTSFDTPSGVGAENSTQEIADSKAALIDAVFWANFAHLTFDDEMAALAPSLTPPAATATFFEGPGDTDASGITPPVADNLRKLLVLMCTNPSSSILSTKVSSVTMDNILFDNLNTPGVVESKEQIAAQAIINTLDYLATTLSPNPASWTWGSVHTLTLDFLLPNPSLNLPVQGDMMYPNGYPRHGDDGTVDVGSSGLDLTNFTYNLGPAIRFGADIGASGIQAQNALPGGETFDPASPHYQDQLVQWLAGTPFPLAFTNAAVVASAQTEYATNKNGRVVFTP